MMPLKRKVFPPPIGAKIAWRAPKSALGKIGKRVTGSISMVPAIFPDSQQFFGINRHGA